MNGFVLEQLKEFGLAGSDISEIRSKDGIFVYRVYSGTETYVLKCFENPEFRREIENYKILSSLQVPTIKIIASTNCALLMEDIEENDKFRLGTEEDLQDEEVAIQIAKWYKLFHEKGKQFVKEHEDKLYDEADMFTKENLIFVAEKTNTKENPAWEQILNNFETIRKQLFLTEKTFNYNDFYYTNLIVAKDKSSALMFDYNFLGKGYVYADLRNVCSSLNENARTAFLREYGKFNENEVAVDKVVSTLTTLYMACKKPKFPSWAEEELNFVTNGEVLEVINKLLAAK